MMFLKFTFLLDTNTMESPLEILWCILSELLQHYSVFLFLLVFFCIGVRKISSSVYLMCMFTLNTTIITFKVESPCRYSEDVCVASWGIWLAQNFGGIPVSTFFVLNCIRGSGRYEWLWRRLILGSVLLLILANTIAFSIWYEPCLHEWKIPPTEPFAIFMLVMRLVGMIVVIAFGLHMVYSNGCSVKSSTGLFASLSNVLSVSPYAIPHQHASTRLIATVLSLAPCYLMTFHSMLTKQKEHYQELHDHDDDDENYTQHKDDPIELSIPHTMINDDDIT